MATIDLGKIKQVWRGTYNNGTAYVVDDLVAYTDGTITSTYICVANSTGNAPSSGGTAHASWNYVAKGVVDPIPSQSGQSGKFLKTNGSALSFDTVTGGVLQAKQWVKNSVINNSSTSDSVLASPFDGTATITPAAAGNKIKVTYFNSIDHGTTWRSGKFRLEWSSDGGSTYYGLAGTCMSAYSSNDMYGNSVQVTVMFNPNTTNAVKVRVVFNGHNSGNPSKHGQYNNEATDGNTVAMDSVNSVTATGHGILLEEYSSAISSITAIS